MTQTLTDTRSPWRGRPYPHSSRLPTRSLTQTESTETVIFRLLVRELLSVARKDRAPLRKKIQQHLRTTRHAFVAINHLLFVCATTGPDGLDIAIDVLAEAGPALIDVARNYLQKDYPAWMNSQTPRATSDNIWYILLRALCQSRADRIQKFGLVFTASLRGTESIREAAMHAFGDLAASDPLPHTKPDIAALLHEVVKRDSSTAVRETAMEILSDLEG